MAALFALQAEPRLDSPSDMSFDSLLAAIAHRISLHQNAAARIRELVHWASAFPGLTHRGFMLSPSTTSLDASENLSGEERGLILLHLQL